MQRHTCIAILCVVLAGFTSAKEWRKTGQWLEVMTSQGPVRGLRDPSEELYTFHNIPYATAPTGEHKFKAPLPPPTWSEPYDAVDKGIVCPQFKALPIMHNLTMQEQCLIANVYVPDTAKEDLPVLVYIHGGAFQVMFGDWIKLKNFMKTKDIIVVNFNYRLGIHGFLCLGTEDAPGNAGMKDQVALLRWVQQNIAAFGGNPNDVTISGYSAGSISADLLMISKSAKGLFHKVIPESGANIAAFTIQTDPMNIAKEHAKTLNFENNDVYALEKFYKSLSYESLTADGFLDRIDSTFMFAPCIERDTGDGAFLTEPPINILKRGDYDKVPLLYGFADMEGLMRIDFFDMWKTKMNNKFSDFLPVDLKFETEDEKEQVAAQIKKFYFGDKPIDNDNVLGYVDYFSDILINYSMLRAVNLYVEAGHNQVYLYEYSFVDDQTPVVPYTNVRGAYHCDQTVAVSDSRSFLILNEDNISEEFKNMKKIMREIWHSFITTGKPIPAGSSLPAWPAVGSDMSPHMSLGQKVELRGVLLEERTRFWDNIYQKHYREPIPPQQSRIKHNIEL
ncbi:carboxylic ester hydrolase-like [Anticarsia gemmatalis]|uniref:carboxylic ester hydrolase-like n=1 Tax=Anticarsia gemmatalis TaxID=129554 RepID=UPI003F761643